MNRPPRQVCRPMDTLPDLKPHHVLLSTADAAYARHIGGNVAAGIRAALQAHRAEQKPTIYPEAK